MGVLKKDTVAKMERRIRGENVVLTKMDLVRLTAGLAETTIGEAKLVIEAFLYVLRTMLEDSRPGDKVIIKGFGTFVTSHRKIVMKHGLPHIPPEALKPIKGRRTVRFRPSKFIVDKLRMGDDDIEAVRKQRYGQMAEILDRLEKGGPYWYMGREPEDEEEGEEQDEAGEETGGA